MYVLLYHHLTDSTGTCPNATRTRRTLSRAEPPRRATGSPWCLLSAQNCPISFYKLFYHLCKFYVISFIKFTGTVVMLVVMFSTQSHTLLSSHAFLHLCPNKLIPFTCFKFYLTLKLTLILCQIMECIVKGDVQRTCHSLL